MPSFLPQTDPGGWSARLNIEVERRGEASVLGRRSHVGPLRIQRPFYPEGSGCPHVYLLHPPGGLVGGDALETSVVVREGARALFTTPAAQKLYRSPERTSTQRVELAVERGATLEWFPGETICFDAARSRSVTRVALAEDAAFLGWEIVCFGRPASGLPFTVGELGFRFELYRGDRPLLVDRAQVSGGSEVLRGGWGYSANPVFATLYAVARAPGDLSEVVAAVRDRLGADLRFGATALEEMVVLRVGGSTVEPVRALLAQAWDVLRPRLAERAAVPPRIWAV